MLMQIVTQNWYSSRSLTSSFNFVLHCRRQKRYGVLDIDQPNNKIKGILPKIGSKAFGRK